MAGPRRVALYSHDAQGLGHVRRNLAIAAALAADGGHDVIVIAGTKEAALFDTPRGVDVVTLPALAKSPSGAYSARSLGLSLRSLVELRARAIGAVVDGFDPDVLIVDKLPLGLGGELRPALDLVRARRGTRLVLGLREVLDAPSVVRREWARTGAVAAMRSVYDAIWVYGDRRVYDPAVEYGLDPVTAAKVRYVGYLGRAAPAAAPDAIETLGLPCRDVVLCLVGGGQDGFGLASTFARAVLPAGACGVIIAGPHMPAHHRRALDDLVRGRSRLRVLDFVHEPLALIAAARCVVAMGGYNTVCELLSMACRTLVVPRVRPRHEQLIRAERLSALGVLDALHPDALVPEALSAWMASRPGPRRPPAELLDLDGLRRVPELLEETCSESAEGHALAV